MKIDSIGGTNQALKNFNKTMILAKRVRLRPTKEQETHLWKSVGTSRWAYNWALSKQEENFKAGGCMKYQIISQNKQSKIFVKRIKISLMG